MENSLNQYLIKYLCLILLGLYWEAPIMVNSTCSSDKDLFSHVKWSGLINSIFGTLIVLVNL